MPTNLPVRKLSSNSILRYLRFHFLVLASIVVVSGRTPCLAADTYSMTGYFPVLPQPWYFSRPTQIAFSPGGSLYVADSGSYTIVKLAASGQFSQSWGSHGDGSGQFRVLEGIAVDSTGIVYASDIMSEKIQKFSSSGIPLASWVTDLTYSPSYLSVDPSSRIYVSASSITHPTLETPSVARYLADGTFVDRYTLPADQPFGPGQVAFDASGNVYIVDSAGSIRKLSQSWLPLGQFGSSGTGNGQFVSPRGIAIDSSSNAYVSDIDRHDVQKFDSSGAFVSKWGGLGGANGQLDQPNALAMGPDGNLYVVEIRNQRISVFTTTGSFVKEMGSAGSANGFFRHPNEVAIDPSGNVYVIDTGNNRVQKFDRKGKFIRSWGSSGSGVGQFAKPKGVAADSSGNIYVADTGNSRIQKFDKDGAFIRAWGTNGFDAGQFQAPVGISINPPGNVTVVDAENNGFGAYSIQHFDEDGSFLGRWGMTGDSPGEVKSPTAVATDPTGNVYVADTGNFRIDRYTADGTFVRQWNTGFLVQGVCTDRSGFVYVPDPNGKRVVKYDGNGNVVTTIQPPADFTSRFGGPIGCEVSASGDLYVADPSRNRIVVFSRGPASSKTIGAAASAPGALETYWRTDASVANLSSSPIDIAASFTPRGSSSPSSITLSLAAGESKSYGDLVQTLFGATPAAGAIVLTSDSPGLVSSSRTYTSVSSGTYGQGVPACDVSDSIFIMGPGELLGLERSEAYRTNIGFVNTTDESCTISLTLIDIRGSPIGEKTYTLSGHEPLQVNDVFADLGLSGSFDTIRGEVRTESGCGIAAYASIIDNRSGDPVYRTAKKPGGFSPEERASLLPVVAHAPGLNGTSWRSDLLATNTGAEPIDADVLFLDADGLRGSQPSFSMSLDVGESVAISDVVSSKLSLNQGAGALLVTSSGSGLVLESRTYNDAATGTYGQGVSAVDGAQLFSSTRPANLLGVTRDAEFRTNLGLVNVATVPATVTVSLLATDGEPVAEKSFTLPALGFLQVTDIAGSLGLSGDQENLRAKISTDQTEVDFFAYISRVDNGTGDAVFEAGL